MKWKVTKMIKWYYSRKNGNIFEYSKEGKIEMLAEAKELYGSFGRIFWVLFYKVIKV